MKLSWSTVIPFEQDAVRRLIPDAPGVYKIVQAPDYARYEGSTPTLKIGKSDVSLQREILNHFQRHTVANRLYRVRSRPGVTVSVTYAVLDSDETTTVELAQLKEFEDAHWDLPILNAQRGYKRTEDSHYRTEVL